MKLGTLLLRDAIITLTQLEAALRAQVLGGGRLGTNLVELGFVDVDTLGSYLARVLEVPVARREHFENAPAAALDALGPALADLHSAVPLGFEGDDRKILAVALLEPKNPSLIEKLSVHAGKQIRAYCAPELRLYYYLEKHYHLPRKARYLRSGGKGPPSAVSERRRSAPGATPPPVLLTPRAKTPSQSPPVQTPQHEVAAIARALDGAVHREQVGDALLRVAEGRFGAVAIFGVRDHTAVGWRALTGAGEDRAVDQFVLPLTGSSALQMARDSGQVFRGPPPAPGKPTERRLWKALECTDEPDEVLVAPIKVRDRVINLFYAHPYPGTRFDDRAVSDALSLVDRASDAYLRILADAKLA